MAAPQRRFLYVLAARLGRTVAELETSLSSLEFAEWLAIWKWQPWDDLPAAPETTTETELDPLAFANVIHGK